MRRIRNIMLCCWSRLTAARLHPCVFWAIVCATPTQLLAQSRSGHSPLEKARQLGLQKEAPTASNIDRWMKGSLDFLRNDNYHFGPRDNKDYTPWYSENTLGGLTRIYNYKMFARDFDESIPTSDNRRYRMTSSDNFGSFIGHIDYRSKEEVGGIKVAPLLAQSSYSGDPEAITAALFMRSIGKSNDLIRKIDRESGEKLELEMLKYGINPLQSLSSIFLDQDLSKESQHTSLEKVHSQTILTAMQTFFREGTGPISRKIDPIILRNYRQSIKDKKLNSKQFTLMQAAVEDAIAEDIVERLLEKHEAKVLAEAQSSSEHGHELARDTPPNGHGNKATSKDPITVIDKNFTTPPAILFGTKLASIPEYLMCANSLLESLITETDRSISESAFIKEYAMYLESCTDKAIPSHRFKHEAYLEEIAKLSAITYLETQSMPHIKAKLNSHGTLTENEHKTARLYDHLYSGQVKDLIGISPDESENKAYFARHSPVNHNSPSLPNEEFLKMNLAINQAMKKHNIGIRADECAKGLKIKSSTFHQAVDFQYTNCPTLDFTNSKIMDPNSDFWSDPLAIAHVYNQLTFYGHRPSGIQEFKNLLNIVEFERRKKFMAEHKPGDGAVYKPAAIFDPSNETLKKAGILACEMAPPNFLPEDCSSFQPSSAFLSVFSDSLGESSQALSFSTKTNSRINNGKPLYVFEKDPKHGFMKSPPLVGNTIVSYNAKAEQFLNDEYSYHSKARLAIDALHAANKDLQNKTAAASTTWNGVKSCLVAIPVGAADLVGCDTSDNHLTGANKELFESVDAFWKTQDKQSAILDELGIQSQRGNNVDPVYQGNTVEHKVLDEDGKSTKIERTIEYPACHKGEQTAGMSSSNATELFTSHYTHQLTCYDRLVGSTAVGQSMDAFSSNLTTVGKNMLWTAATVVTLPVGGLVFNAAYRGTVAAVGIGARAAGTTYNTVKMTRGLQATAQLSRLNKIKEITSVAWKSGSSTFARGTSLSLQTASKAARGATMTQHLLAGAKTAGTAVGFMKVFGGAQVGYEQVSGKLANTPGGASDAWISTLIGGHDPKSLATTMMIMGGADGIALGAKTIINANRTRVGASLFQNSSVAALKQFGARPIFQKAVSDPKLLAAIDRTTTQLGNYASEVAISGYFFKDAADARSANNEVIRDQIAKIDEDIKAAEARGDTGTVDVLNKSKKEQEERLQTLWDYKFDALIDIGGAVAFRNARPGDFGAASLSNMHMNTVNNFVNTSVNLPRTKPVKVTAEDGSTQTLYRMEEADYKVMVNQILAQESRFQNALRGSTDGDKVAASFEYIPFMGVKEEGGTYLVNPEFKTWRSYRFRDRLSF